ncbi:hypothetical protein AX774_g7534 [Zancudomyces culisetae]|uniref:Uncharacterized protein n=1 Tax=Zancudomyces culisetae TaxID=1213189 RepID=A0A1R1PDS8_ZANCU|nr:hypothetical protein AX774_g7534 [Zancudomyces culisetae]|eukprot:OMH79063.1 hypothetical protein AX774_g7534 [Zancudomyces culisetae]
MNSENNSNSLFNKLPVSILSKAFVLAQNPQLSLLNKNMHYASQQVDTISKYIVKYTLSNTETSLEYNISTVLENYTRINMNETIGILVFRKIKKIDYEIALEMAIKYKWKNVLNKLLRMYVAIDRNTSTVVYKDTLFMNEGEYLDIDIGNMFSEENEFQRDFTNINISENLYARPVITTHSSLQKLLIKINREFEKDDVEALIDSWDSKIEIPTEFTGSVVTDVKFIDILN